MRPRPWRILLFRFGAGARLSALAKPATAIRRRIGPVVRSIPKATAAGTASSPLWRVGSPAPLSFCKPVGCCNPPNRAP